VCECVCFRCFGAAPRVKIKVNRGVAAGQRTISDIVLVRLRLI